MISIKNIWSILKYSKSLKPKRFNAMTTNATALAIKDTTANPAPLGLLGFGMTTVLLNLHNAGLFELDSMIMGMGIFVGGIAQIFAGLQEWKKGNTFAST